MTRKINYTLLFGLSFILCACGFHLRGYNNTSYKFPFKTVYVQCDNVVICSNLKIMIKTDDLAKLESSPEKAEATIRVFNEQTSRDSQGFNAVGRISAYILTYQIEAQILRNKEVIGNPINVSVQSVMQYNDATILADTQEEANFWDNLHQNATYQLARKIVYFKSSKNNDTESQ